MSRQRRYFHHDLENREDLIYTYIYFILFFPFVTKRVVTVTVLIYLPEYFTDGKYLLLQLRPVFADFCFHGGDHNISRDERKKKAEASPNIFLIFSIVTNVFL
ncbi:hypothetical protein PUN28_000109 [Cardiocondyla obscurior]|uniref:Uncharacterized protein n=1 Tax=Cardiocondyla obscurior TaxID=286306 RepID=A0AAW2GY31_9HYME